ncbi:MAG: PEP-CTERM-box response regulator transcription factor [candidate division Zixibacteria bacterium]|nr:PEP-CTERM-box response regulator transcription factor [candidate division Zixibacteria bacterium]
MENTIEKHTILIVDDDDGVRTQLKWALKPDYNVIEAAAPDEALIKAKEHHPLVVLQDIALSSREGASEGLFLVNKYLNVFPYCKIIMVTGHGTKDNALEAIALGAYDFFSKPVDIDQLKIMIKRGIKVAQLEQENNKLIAELAKVKSFESIIGDSISMKEIYKTIHTVSATDYTVLITGESGTGKELVSKAIHSASPRVHCPFITINCGAIPENLLESELFGHEKGAFTDAHIQKIGKFELANKGTIFLDEIGELSLNLQVKLLRVLEDHTIDRIGGKEPIALDVRVLAATNRDLLEEVGQGRFREDLYYRLSVINIEMPLLHERGDDVLLLANTFLNRYGAENGRPNLSFTEAASRSIASYKWPGNVRELENKIKRAVIMAQEKKIKPKDLLLPDSGDSGEDRLSLQSVREVAEKTYLIESLIRNNWNISRVSREIGTSRTTLYDLIEKYNLRK